MIMKRITLYLSIALAALAMTSCKGFLDRDPKLQQSTDLTLSTYGGLNKATLGAYYYLATSGWYTGERVLESEMRSGNGTKDQKHNSNRYSTQFNWNYTEDATSDLWAYGYTTISAANNVIHNLEGKETSDVTTQDLNNLKAECLFIRAISHFDMVTLYAQPYSYATKNPIFTNGELGVPYVFKTDPAGRPERNTVAEVYDYVVEDLLEAERLIDPDYVRSGVASPKAVVTLEAIQALLSRVYLYMENWQEAANYATKVIESEKFKMWTEENYVDAWIQNVGSDEVIFEVYVSSNSLSNTDCSYMTYPDGAYGDCLASNELVALYEDGDIRKETYRMDKDETPGLYWTTKYAGKGLNIPDANNTVILRLSEMYLNRAEALVKGAEIEGASALGDLTTITSNRGAAAYAAAGMEAVKTERRKELAWEGHHFFDKARWNESVTRSANSFLSPDRQTIPFPDKRWALPIPKRELDVNKNLKQNEL